MPLILNGNGTISTSATTGTSITTTGYVNMPNQPACLIACQASDIAWPSGGIINYGGNAVSGSFASTKIFDNTNSFNMTTSRFTAPIAGTYFISFTANGAPGNSAGTVPRGYPRINGSYIGQQLHLRGNSTLAASGGDLDQRTMAIIVKLNAGDYFDVYVQYGSFDTFGANYFTAYMVG
jgi:hypothetical protein